MNHEMQDLARRAVACKHWRWMRGMLAEGRRGIPTAWLRLEDDVPKLSGEWANALPDLTDPATLGCLLALVREAHGIPAWLRDEATFGGRWSVCWKDGPHSTAVVAEGDGPDAALVAALEAAP